MNKQKINILNLIIESHPQFAKESLLYEEISEVLNISISDAKKIAATHCNMISFYACLYAAGAYSDDYKTFFKFCYDKKLCTKKGYINDKPDMLKHLGIESDLTTFREYEDISDPVRLNPDKFYQVKIFGNTSGDHFMACYIDNHELYLSDTSSRGIGVKAIDFITEKNFQKISEVF